MGFFDYLRSVFSSSPAQSGGNIIVTGGTGPATAVGQFKTTLERNSNTMLRQLEQAKLYRGLIEEASQLSGLQPAILCGIGSRESHWGLALKPSGPGGTGDASSRRPRGARTTALPPDGGGYGRGLMQIDYDWHEFARTGNWRDPGENLKYACKVLNDARRFFQQRGIRQDLMQRAIIAAYNSGATATWECVQSGQDVDCKTTGRDYSADVLKRAGWFQLHGWR